MAFNGVSLNTKSADQTLTITNTGGSTTGALTTPSRPWQRFRNFWKQLRSGVEAPNQSCTMAINFTPGAIAQSTWTFTVTSASGASATAQLTGTGKQPNVIDISPRDVKGCGELSAALAAVSVPWAPGSASGSDQRRIR